MPWVIAGTLAVFFLVPFYNQVPWPRLLVDWRRRERYAPRTPSKGASR